MIKKMLCSKNVRASLVEGALLLVVHGEGTETSITALLYIYLLRETL
jgi:hypothetical protein